MHKQVRELVEWAEGIGFTRGPIDGSGHYRLTHSNGDGYMIPATPSDWRGVLNAKADMRRIANAEHDGPNSGKHRKGVSRNKPVRHLASPDDTERGKEVAGLRKNHKAICDQIGRIQSDDHAGAHQKLQLVRGLLAVEERLAFMGEQAPKRGFRFTNV